MLDDATPQASGDTPRCTWCSSVLPSDSEVSCPTCGATLIGEGDSQVPGLTAIDAEAILRAARAAKAKPRSRLMAWISGEYEEGADKAPAAPGSLDPPSGDVRREMLRLELQAQVANLQAEAESMAADAAVETGEIVEVPDVAELVAEAAENVEIPEEMLAEDAAAEAAAAEAATETTTATADVDDEDRPPA